MKLSDNTISVLKNFASINSNIVIDTGNTIRTISEAKNILAKIDVEETFDQEFGIYDLNEFLGVINLVDSPENKPTLNFQENFVTISDASGLANIKYFFSDTDMLTRAGKDVRMPEGEVKFNLDEGVLQKLKAAASALGHTELIIEGVSDKLAKITVTTSATSPNATYKFIYNINNLKILTGNYEVEISSQKISKLTNSTNGLQYWIALEKTSTYGE